jgi:site-specific recombinase XerD
MRSSLDLVAGFLSEGRLDSLSIDWSKIRYQHMSAVRGTVAEVYAPSTGNKMLSAVKGVLRECMRLGYTSAEEYAKSSDIPSVKGYRDPKGRALSKSELSRVFSSCSQDDKRSKGLRDYAILAVMYSSGLRRSEVSSLDISDYVKNPDGLGYLTVRSGKGNMDRSSPINSAACESIERWLELRRGAEIQESQGTSQGTLDKPLFNPIGKSGKISDKRMTDQGVLYVLQRRAQEGGVSSFTPHDLRRTFIGDLLDAGADIATVQKLAGHANVQTTARYDRRGEQAKRKAASLLDIP